MVEFKWNTYPPETKWRKWIIWFYLCKLTMHLHSGMADQNFFVHSVLIYVFWLSKAFQLILYRVFFLCCDVMLLFPKKGEGLVPLKRLIPLQMFAPVLCQESNVYVICTCFSFLVFYIDITVGLSVWMVLQQ